MSAWAYIPLLIVTHLACVIVGACAMCWALFGPVDPVDDKDDAGQS